MITITIGGSTFCDTGRGPWGRGIQGGYIPSPEAEAKGFEVAFFAKAVETQF